jgi:DNA-binding transcriptional LysR family regulator
VEQLNLVQVETFYWVAKLGSFQAAADRLHTTQPGVSTRIRQLEQTLGVELFDRSGRSARLTPKGRELVDYAQRLLGLADSIRLRIGDPSALAGRIRLGVADTAALTWLPELLARGRAAFPNLDVELEVNLTLNLLTQLGERQIDLAIVAGPVADPELTVVPLCRYVQRWVAAPRIIPDTLPLTPAQLAELPIITHTRGSHQHQMILRWFRKHDAEPRRISTCTSLATIVRLTVAGLGASIQTDTVIRREHDAGEIVPIATTTPVQPLEFSAVFPSAEGSIASRMLAELAAEVATAFVPPAPDT